MRYIPTTRKNAAAAFTIALDDGTEIGEIWLQGNLWYAENTQGWQVKGPINGGFQRQGHARLALNDGKEG